MVEQKSNKKSMIKNYVNTAKLLAAMAISTFSLNNAEAQVFRPGTQPTPTHQEQEKTARLDFILGTSFGIHNVTTDNPGENIYLDIGFKRSTKDLGLGLSYSMPLNETDLGTTTEEMRIDRGGANPYTKVENLKTRKYSTNNVLEAIISFERENSAFFITKGMHQEKTVRAQQISTHREYEENGNIIKTPTIEGPEHELEDITTSSIIGAGLKVKRGNFGIHAKASTTLKSSDNKRYFGIGISYGFSQ